MNANRQQDLLDKTEQFLAKRDGIDKVQVFLKPDSHT